MYVRGMWEKIGIKTKFPSYTYVCIYAYHTYKFSQSQEICEISLRN